MFRITKIPRGYIFGNLGYLTVRLGVVRWLNICIRKFEQSKTEVNKTINRRTKK